MPASRISHRSCQQNSHWLNWNQARHANLIEDQLTSLLAEWIDMHLPKNLPTSTPVHVARRDEIRTRP